MPSPLRTGLLPHETVHSTLGRVRTDTWRAAACAAAPFLLVSSDSRLPGAEHFGEDCDCACPTPAHPPATREHVPLDFSENYTVHPHLQIESLSQDAFVAFQPYADQHPVVLNRALYQLLDTFRTPRPLTALCEPLSNDSTDDLESFARQMVDHHLLEEAPVTLTRRIALPDWLTVWMHTTNECNLRCTYCYLNKTTEQMPEKIARQSIRTSIRTARQYGLRGIKFKYAGGEPTLHLAHVLDLHRFAQRQTEAAGLAYDGVILSNGIGLTGSMLEEIRASSIRLMISLDGVGAANDRQRVFANGHGSFASVDHTIERALRVGLVPHISVTLSDQNIDALPQTIEYLLDHSLSFNLNFYRENDCSASFESLRLVEDRMIVGLMQAYAVIERRLPPESFLGSLLDKGNLVSAHGQPCGVGANYMVIDQWGGIAKCHMDMAHPITHIHADNPLRVIQNDTTRAVNPTVEEKEGCRSCQWKYWCAGGCPIATYRATGRYDIKSPHCHIYKTLYPQVLRLEGLRLQKYASAFSCDA